MTTKQKAKPTSPPSSPWADYQPNQDHVREATQVFLQIVKGTDDEAHHPLVKGGFFGIKMAQGSLLGLTPDDLPDGWAVVTRKFLNSQEQVFATDRVKLAVRSLSVVWQIKDRNGWRDATPADKGKKEVSWRSITRVLCLLGNVPSPGYVVLTSGKSSALSSALANKPKPDSKQKWGLVRQHSYDMRQLTQTVAGQVFPQYACWMPLRMVDGQGWVDTGEGQPMQIPFGEWGQDIIAGADGVAKTALLNELFVADWVEQLEADADDAQAWWESQRNRTAVDEGDVDSGNVEDDEPEDEVPAWGAAFPAPEFEAPASPSGKPSANGEVAQTSVDKNSLGNMSPMEQAAYQVKDAFVSVTGAAASKSTDKVNALIGKWKQVFPEGVSNDPVVRVYQHRAVVAVANGKPQSEAAAEFAQAVAEEVF